ncbi:monovalent cation/H+ antiporter subunit D [Orrella sp. JC864]|uniref:monovalent cation/H+ antiporter subunit D n=1 Tax=Orrella sp. JC864 TaxID=3120298 RepID=UPI00300A8953
MNFLLNHLPILPIVLPLVTGAAMLLLGDSHRTARTVLNLVATTLLLAVSLLLLGQVSGETGVRSLVYLPANWPAPFGIVLVADRLAVLMLVLVAVLGLACLVASLSRWDRVGVHFHPLLQFQLMGLNGAFLTGDLFNLFVFFEILLASSYGLLLHGSGVARVRSGLHYIAVNLVGAFLFLIGVSLIYGAAGTLNMADLAVRMPAIAGPERALLHAGLAVLGCAFLIKAAVWPLNFWLVAAYTSATPPVAALFAIMTKVGIYAVLRLSSLLSGEGASQVLASDWLFAGGLLTLMLGSAGLLGAQELRRQAAYSVLVSSGTLLAAIGLGSTAALGPALYYLITSTLAVSIFFLLIDLIERNRPFGANMLAISLEAFGLDDPVDPDRPDEVVGVALPAVMAILGVGFVVCALLITGLPPLSGFVAKFGLLSASLQGGQGAAVPATGWLMMAGLLLSGLAGVLALARSGIRTFWAVERNVLKLGLLDAAPVFALVLCCVALTIWAEPVLVYLNQTAQALHAPQGYIDAVLGQGGGR